MAIPGQDRSGQVRTEQDSTDQDKRSFPNQFENVNSNIRPKVAQRISNANSSLPFYDTKGWYCSKSTTPLHQLLLLGSKESDLRNTSGL